MVDNPLVSIIIPVYNGSDYVKEAIDSALDQTYQNIEIIVVNDGSNDNDKTEQIVFEYGERVQYIKKTNGGVSSALNMGIQAMKGEYFSWLSHDDVYAKDKIEKQIEILNRYKLKDIVVKSFTNFIDKDSKMINNKKSNSYEKLLQWDDAVLHVTKSGVNGCTLLIPKKAFDTVGTFDERLRYCQDTLMWWKIFLAGYSMLMVNHVGVYSRIHEKQLTRTGSKLFHHDSKIIGKYVIPEFEKKSNRIKNLLYVYAKEQAVHGNYDVVKECIQIGKGRGLIIGTDRISLQVWSLYGCIRPLIRTLYYKIKHNIRIK